MKHLYIGLLLIVILFPNTLWSSDYIEYHRLIYKAEKLIFVDNKLEEGLSQFKSVFQQFDFIFVDDAIEAFQIALIYKKEKNALYFIHRAMDNGMPIVMLNKLNRGCYCNLFENSGKVTIFDSFLVKYGLHLADYQDSAMQKYAKLIDKALFIQLTDRHIYEQIYKAGHGEKTEQVYAVNYAMLSSYADKGIYLGQKNIGIYSHELQYLLTGDNDYLKHRSSSIVRSCHEAKVKNPPICDENSFWSNKPVFIMLFHGLDQRNNTINIVHKHEEAAIKGGFWHPREVAYLEQSAISENSRQDDEMILAPGKKMNILYEGDQLKKINDLRSLYLLPAYETDYYKHQYAHKHGLQLFFGFNNATQ